MSTIAVLILMCLFLMVFLATGTPLCFVLGGLAMIFTALLWGPQALMLSVYSIFQIMSYVLLVAIPLFIFMGNMLERSGIIEDLFNAMNMWIGRLRGGLCVGTIGICVVIAAMVGLSGPAMVTMGLIALPAMLRHGYNKRMATGAIMSASTLGILIPPSVGAVFYALIARESVGKMFLGGFFPGLLLASLYSLYIIIRCTLQPHMAPPMEASFPWKTKFKSLGSIFLPALIVISVLGSIVLGIASPTEAAAIGALASVFAVIVKRRFSWRLFFDVVHEAFTINALMMWLCGGALLFGKTFDAVGAAEVVKHVFESMDLGFWGILILMQLSMFVLGMFLDDTSQYFIVLPLFLSILDEFQISRIWFGVLFLVNQQMAYVSPPFGYNIFYMKSVAPPEVKIEDIYMSVWPFIILMAVGLALCMAFPQIILWLPEKVLGNY